MYICSPGSLNIKNSAGNCKQTKPQCEGACCTVFYMYMSGCPQMRQRLKSSFDRYECMSVLSAVRATVGEMIAEDRIERVTVFSQADHRFTIMLSV